MNCNSLKAQWTLSSAFSTSTKAAYICSFASSEPTIFVAAYTGGLFRSVDEGVTWTPCKNGMPDFWVRSLAVLGNTIFVGGEYPNGVYRSADNGETWSAANSGLGSASVNAFAVLGAKIFAGTAVNGVFMSSDSGANWVNIGDVNNGLTGVYITSLAVTDDALYAGTDLGLFCSVNNGASWKAMNSGLINPPYIYSIGVTSTKLFVGCGANYPGVHGGPTMYGAGGYFSIDKGQSWKKVTIGDTTYNEINSFVFNDQTYFAASQCGVLVSTDKGISWAPMNTGLQRTGVKYLIVHGANVFTGGSDGTVWRRPLSDFVSTVEEKTKLIPMNVILEQNYPNPFNPTTTISFSLPTSSFITLKIYDVMGREVATLMSQVKEAGVHTVEWNASGMPSGVYFYRLQAGAYTETRRLLLLR